MAAFRHEALFYSGSDEFVERISAFARDGLEAGEPVLVVVDRPKLGALRDTLGSAAELVRFADMAEVGENPARIIPAWRDFVAEHRGRPVRGVGEPITTTRGSDELVECHRHEALLNVAFAEDPDFQLLCPYDTSALSQAVIREAHRTHPHIAGSGESPDYAHGHAFAPELSAPPGHPDELAFHGRSLAAVRRFVAWRAADAGLTARRVEDAILAVSELAANSVRHGGGEGVLRVWRHGHGLTCEIRDQGVIDAPLAGRVRPEIGQEGGYGLWLVNQLCELVQIRPHVVRVTIR